MDDFTYDEFLARVGTAFVNNPSWRYGQTVFNVLHFHRPDIANNIRGSAFDPFYMDGTDPRLNRTLDYIKVSW